MKQEKMIRIFFIQYIVFVIVYHIYFNTGIEKLLILLYVGQCKQKGVI